VPASTVSLNASIADVRALRAAAFPPRVVALTLIVVLPVPIAAGSDRTVLAGMVGGALLLWLYAALLERGVAAAAMFGAVSTLAVVVMTLFELARHRSQEFWSGAAGMVVFCVPAWLALRAVGASRRLGRLGRRPHARSSTFRKLAHLPRDARLIQSLGPFLGAYAIWTVGAAGGLMAAAVVSGGHGLVLSLVFFPFALAGGRMFDSGRRRLALRLDEVRALDPRPPLLLLRSFADDNLPLERRFSMLGNLLQRPFTLEELIVDRLWPVGPVMAIGAPGETLRPAGAAREYVADEMWHERLLSGLDESRAVVGVLGASEGVMWEFGQVDARGASDRFVLVCPPHPAQVIRRRWEALAQAFPAAVDAGFPAEATVGTPLAAVFPRGGPPVFYCSKYRNETAYGMVLDEIVRRHLLPSKNP
jgi:hypothetical protein